MSSKSVAPETPGNSITVASGAEPVPPEPQAAIAGIPAMARPTHNTRRAMLTGATIPGSYRSNECQWLWRRPRTVPRDRHVIRRITSVIAGPLGAS